MKDVKMDILKLKSSFTKNKKAHRDFREYAEVSKQATKEYRDVIFCMFRIFDEVEEFPEDYIDIIPISIEFREGITDFHKMGFNVKNGRVVNLYFKNSKRDFLKYAELLSFFDSEDQIDELLRVLEIVRDSLI